MGRAPKAWYREDRDTWHATIRGVRHKLATGKNSGKAAEKELHRLLGGDDPRERPSAKPGTGQSAEWICFRLLDHVNREKAQATYEWYGRHLLSFAADCGKLPAREIRPFHVTAWLDKHRWGPTTRAGAITAVKRAFRWAKRQGYLESNPIEDMERPRVHRREEILTTAQFDAILADAGDEAWRRFLVALSQTGCRPGELAALEIRGKDSRVDLEAGTWTVLNKTRHKRDRTRTIHLTPAMRAMTAELVEARKEGLLFVNSRGRAWTRNAMACRFRRIREKLGFGVEATAYSLRHLYVTDALEREVPIATVAELVGHADTTMISRVYSKLGKRSDHLREAAAKVRPPKD